MLRGHVPLRRGRFGTSPAEVWRGQLLRNNAGQALTFAEEQWRRCVLFRFAREVGWRYVPIAGSDAGNHLAWCPSSDEEDSSSEAGTYELDNIMSSSEAASDMASTIPGSSAGHEDSSEVISVEDDFEPVD